MNAYNEHPGGRGRYDTRPNIQDSGDYPRGRGGYPDRDWKGADPYAMRGKDPAYPARPASPSGPGDYPRGRGGYPDRDWRGADPYNGRGDPYPREDPYAMRGRDPIYATSIQPAREANGYDPAPGRYDDHNGAVPLEYPTFELDHLATFTLSKKQGTVSPDEGIERLRNMEMTTGIWTMRCKLVVQKQDVTIIDKQTGEEMEKFPLSLIQNPTARMNQDRRDVYNNIVLFTVLADPSRQSESEMHIFQCISKPAQEVVDDINAGKSGRLNANYSAAPPPPPPVEMRHHVRDDEAAARAARAADQYEPGPRPGPAFRKSMYREETESMLSEKTDRDVQLLNHCFNDIEKFVGRLQQSAEAFRELERRRQKRDKRHKKRNGDGMLSVRARPPPAKDFIDVFQKFKLAFNLLAILKPHIHDPNAPELVHFLFTPLSLVVEASKDPTHGTPDLAAKVVSPLLSAEAKDLLLNCLTSKETDLWRSLGDAWTVSREQWKGYVPAYTPRFLDGWSASGFDERPGFDKENRRPRDRMDYERDRRNEPRGPYDDPYPRGPPDEPYARGPPVDPYRQGPPLSRGPPDDPYSRGPPEDPYRQGPPLSRGPPDDPYSRGPPDDRYRQGPPPPRGLYEDPYSRGPPDDFRMRAPEGRGPNDMDRRRPDDYPLYDNRDGRISPRAASPRPVSPPPPETMPYHPKPPSPPPQTSMPGQGVSDPWLRDLLNSGATIYEAIHDRQSKNAKELTVKKGEYLEVLDDSRNWWKLRNRQGQTGHAPYTILQPLDPESIR